MSEPKCRLGDIAQINPETLGIDTASDYFFKYIDISSVNQGVIDWSSVRSYQFCDAPSRARRIIRQNDVLICTVRPGLQAHCFIGRSDYGNLVASTGFAVVRCGSDISPRYLFHSLFGPDIPAQLRKKETGSNYPAVNERDIQDIFILCPAITIQNKIARILDTLDEAILKTEQLIAKLKAIKQGLLHDLLTRGLDENGQLRDPVAHPEQFKPSPLGPIPKEWEIDPISKICKIINGGTPTTNISKYWNGDIPWLTVEDFNTGKRFVYEATKTITEKGLMESATSLLPKGALIISARGTVGVIAQLGREMAFNQSCYGLISKRRECSENYLYYFLNEFMGKFKQATFGSVFDTITRATFDKILIGYPPNEEESERIVENLASVDSLLEKNQEEAGKLRLLKKGLMHDLLTGKVRVNIKEENRGQVKGDNF
jgi:type I restriction enzyme S subunit